jgi:hypothetical protein
MVATKLFFFFVKHLISPFFYTLYIKIYFCDFTKKWPKSPKKRSEEAAKTKSNQGDGAITI